MSEASLQEQLADLERIASLEDPVLRNLLITQRYHDLSQDLAKVLGPGNANWSTFATWASKTAGLSIREEEVPEEFATFLEKHARLDERLDALKKKLGPLGRFFPDLDPFELARAIIAEVASQIAEGNLRVYHELSPLFAKFAQQFSPQEQRKEQDIVAFCSSLKNGPPSKGGQDELKKAFKAYFEAADCPDDERRAQLILYGNVLIGFHEQTRLQDNIEGALNAPFSPRIYERFGDFGPKFLQPLFRAVIQRTVRFFSRELVEDWELLATRFLMKLSAPNGTEIPLDEDIQGEAFPPLLTTLTLKELRDLLSRFDANVDSPRGMGATNWTKLPDRMGFIGDLFRLKQTNPAWFGQPFSKEVQNDIEAGRLPNEFAKRLRQERGGPEGLQQPRH